MKNDLIYDETLQNFVIDDETVYFHLRPSSDYTLNAFRKGYKSLLRAHHHDNDFITVQGVRALAILFSKDSIEEQLPNLSQQAQKLLTNQTLSITGHVSSRFERTLRAHCLVKRKSVSIIRNPETGTTGVTINEIR